jgi:hypothetical protein
LGVYLPGMISHEDLDALRKVEQPVGARHHPT